MSEKVSQRRRPRADAELRRIRIVDTAARVFGAAEGASMDDVARESGVSRQTVYAHFPSRDQLTAAVVERLSEQTMHAIDAADLTNGPALEAILRLIDTSWDMFERYPVVLSIASGTPDAVDPRGITHDPIREHLRGIIRRGRRTGDIVATPSADWLISATIALGHQAGAEVVSGRMSARSARAALAASLRRLYSASSSATGAHG